MAVNVNPIITAFLVLSIASTSWILLHFLMKPKKRLDSAGPRFIFCLNLADWIGAMGWLLNMYTKVCPTFAFFNFLGYFSTAFWNCSIGIFLWYAMRMKPLPYEGIFYAVCWLIPLTLSSVVIGMGWVFTYPPPTGCWIDFTKQTWVISLPRVLLTGIYTLFLLHIIYRVRKYKDFLSWSNTSRASKINRKLFILQLSFIPYTLASVFNITAALAKVPVLVPPALCLLALQGVLNALATREGKIQRFTMKIYNQLLGKDDKSSSSSSGMSKEPASKASSTASSSSDSDTPPKDPEAGTNGTDDNNHTNNHVSVAISV